MRWPIFLATGAPRISIPQVGQFQLRHVAGEAQAVEAKTAVWAFGVAQGRIQGCRCVAIGAAAQDARQVVILDNEPGPWKGRPQIEKTTKYGRLR